MATDPVRRRLMIAGAGTALGAGAVLRHLSSDAGAAPLLLSAGNDDRGGHWLAAWSRRDKLDFRVRVPVRAHAVTGVPGRRKAIWFARRPGTTAFVVDLDRQRIEREIESTDGRHFYGHGVFSRDGHYLYATENDYERGRGVVGVYDRTESYRRVAEYPAGGIGPHELALMQDGHTLAIAIGGIRTHPARPREKLNIDSMQSALVYMDRRNGRVLGRYLASDGRMSIRHLSVTPADEIVAGVQYEGNADTLRPLVLSHRGEDRLQAMDAGAEVWMSHRQYIASIATSADGSTALATAPRGNTLSLWDLQNGTLKAQYAVPDVAGAGYSADSDEFYVSNGMGHLLAIPAGKPAQPERRYTGRELRWDNHLTISRQR